MTANLNRRIDKLENPPEPIKSTGGVARIGFYEPDNPGMIRTESGERMSREAFERLKGPKIYLPENHREDLAG